MFLSGYARINRGSIDEEEETNEPQIDIQGDSAAAAAPAADHWHLNLLLFVSPKPWIIASPTASFNMTFTSMHKILAYVT